MARKTRGMSQAELGDKAGCGQSHISRIEKNQNQELMPDGPTIGALHEIAAALGMQAWELLVDGPELRREAIERYLGPPTQPRIGHD